MSRDMLLASCVTYVGNLIDFNSGGYKALSHSLNIQVPLTETTLFTPRRCFERTAEKCYDDSLSSIIASYSWDKQVAVRIGSRFDTPGEEVDDLIEVNVYNFLYMVSSVGGTKSNTACLGEEVDLMKMVRKPILILLGEK